MVEVAMLKKLVGEGPASQLLALMDKLPPERKNPWLHKLLRYLTTQDKSVTGEMMYAHPPVSVHEFMENKFYLGKREEIYPVVLAELVEINSGKYDEVILTGGIGAAKTTIALYSQAYQIYLLSCLKNPHAVFGLDRSSEIKIIFQSLNKNLAKGIDFARFRSLIGASPYFKNHFPYDESIESVLKFPNRIEVEPVSGMQTAAIGQNVIGGVIDEVNFMAVIERSKKSVDGGIFDQAHALYNAIARRRKSRFMRNGSLPGLLCLVSSKRVPGQFTDKKAEEAKTNKRIYVYDRRVWEVKPDGTYSGEKFYIFVGDETRQPRMLGPGEEVADSDRHLVDAIPVEYRQDFLDDISESLRDIAGKSTLAVHPFLPRREDVLRNFGKRQNLFVKDSLDFSIERAKIRMQLLGVNPKNPRWVHIDLGLTSDSAGVVIGHVPSFVKMVRVNGEEKFSEILPVIELDGILEVVPPRSSGGEIDFAAIRRILYKLRDMGLPIKWVSLDSYQSADTMQILRQQGFNVGYQSIDTSMLPYDFTKQALYDGRVVAPKHAKLERELVCLERDFAKGKVDHPSHGSKDIADSLAGVIFGLTTRRETWILHNVPIVQAISVSSVLREKEQEEKGPPERRRRVHK